MLRISCLCFYSAQKSTIYYSLIQYYIILFINYVNILTNVKRLFLWKKKNITFFCTVFNQSTINAKKFSTFLIKIR